MLQIHTHSIMSRNCAFVFRIPNINLHHLQSLILIFSLFIETLVIKKWISALVTSETMSNLMLARIHDSINWSNQVNTSLFPNFKTPFIFLQFDLWLNIVWQSLKKTNIIFQKLVPDAPQSKITDPKLSPKKQVLFSSSFWLSNTIFCLTVIGTFSGLSLTQRKLQLLIQYQEDISSGWGGFLHFYHFCWITEKLSSWPMTEMHFDASSVSKVVPYVTRGYINFSFNLNYWTLILCKSNTGLPSHVFFQHNFKI